MLSRSSRNPSSRSSIDRLLGGPQGRLWATEERDKKSCGVPERSGTHSNVRLAVVPLSGEVRTAVRRPQWKYTRKVRKTSGCRAIRSSALTTARFSGRHGRKLAEDGGENRAVPLTAVLHPGACRAGTRCNSLAMLRKRRGVGADTMRALELTTGENKSGSK